MSKKSKLSKPFYKRIWEDSQTTFLAYTQAVSAAVLAGMSELNSFVSDSHFQNLLTNLTVPKSVYIGLAVLSLVTWLAHGRGNNS